MPFVEITSGFWKRDFKLLEPGNLVRGKVGGRDTAVEIIDGDQITFNGVVLGTEKAGVIFDRDGRWRTTRKFIAYLIQDKVDDLFENSRLASLDIVAPGAFLDSLESVERLARIQAGDNNAGKWTLGRLFAALVSVGTTERYSKDP